MMAETGVHLPANDFLSKYLSESAMSPGMQSNPNTHMNFFRDEATTHQEGISHNFTNGTVTNGNDYHPDRYFDNASTETKLKTLNHDLLSLGFNPLYHEYSGNFELERLVSCTDSLLQMYRGNQRSKEEMIDKQRRATCDIEHLQVIQNRLKGTIKQYETDISNLELKEEQLLQKNRNLLKQVKNEREEVKRLHSVLQHRDAQYKHEVKKHERAHLKLKDRIHQLLTDKHDKKTGIKISNALQRSDGKRGTWNTTTSTVKQEEELFRSVISTYEEKQKEIMVENAELRKTLLDVQKYLIHLLPTSGDRTNLNESHSSMGVCSGGLDYLDATGNSQDDCIDSPREAASDSHFQMPYEIVREDLIKDIKSKCKLLKDHGRGRAGSGGEGSMKKSKTTDKNKEELCRLQEQVAKYRDIVDQQERLLQQSLDMRTSPSDSSLLRETDEGKESEVMRAERQLFAEKLANFEKERHNFTEAAIRLSKERKVFEEERAVFLQKQFMQLTPLHQSDQRPVRHIRRAQSASIQHAKNRRVLPSTPASSEVPDYADQSRVTPLSQHLKPPSPTTADLYRCLGLTSDHPQDSDSPHTSGTRSNSESASLKSSPSSSPSHGLGKRPSLSPEHSARVKKYVEDFRLNLDDYSSSD